MPTAWELTVAFGVDDLGSGGESHGLKRGLGAFPILFPGGGNPSILPAFDGFIYKVRSPSPFQ
ncbi:MULTISPECIES: hypothetical protein [unclassified Coleofasciculus]|uniref:hypothetical protein n=1 Tax=unclassified Coleofasciculus TaxID=2692782 RepID=UPI001882F2CB|nr:MULTISPECIES: hypothetical protein [unclassified Coleofasciculus]MBE9151192.1 hypothetical protein [Coleofasciculus sp. LEGE 07092]